MFFPSSQIHFSLLLLLLLDPLIIAAYTRRYFSSPNTRRMHGVAEKYLIRPNRIRILEEEEENKKGNKSILADPSLSPIVCCTHHPTPSPRPRDAASVLSSHLSLSEWRNGKNQETFLSLPFLRFRERKAFTQWAPRFHLS